MIVSYCFLAASSSLRLLARRRQVRTTAMRHFCRHAYALAQRGVRVYGFANVHRVCAHLDGQRDFAQHVACIRCDLKRLKPLRLYSQLLAGGEYGRP